MKDTKSRRIHALLDAEPGAAAATPEEAAALADYRQAISRLEAAARARAPATLEARIMNSLPPRRITVREWLGSLVPRRQQWAVPALAGALATLVGMLLLSHLTLRPHMQLVRVHFEVHAPDAQRVELLGDFNHWTPGEIRLRGPDASGHWTADVELPEGHYEYLFLVNGKTWVTDPNASTFRPDGFGRENAVVDVYEERS